MSRKQQQEQHQEAVDRLSRLSRNPDFVAWLDFIRQCRDEAIDGMEGVSTEKLHQIAGALSVYQLILNYGASMEQLRGRADG